MQLAVSRAEAGISEVLSTIVVIGCQMLEGTFHITGFLLQSTFGHSYGRKLCTCDAKYASSPAVKKCRMVDFPELRTCRRRCQWVFFQVGKKNNGHIVEFETMVNGQAVDNYRLCLLQEAAFVVPSVSRYAKSDSVSHLQ